MEGPFFLPPSFVDNFLCFPLCTYTTLSNWILLTSKSKPTRGILISIFSVPIKKSYTFFMAHTCYGVPVYQAKDEMMPSPPPSSFLSNDKESKKFVRVKWYNHICVRLFSATSNIKKTKSRDYTSSTPHERRPRC